MNVVGSLWFGLEEKMCLFDELLMEEERLEQECDGTFLSSGEMSSVCHDVRAFSVRTALTRTLRRLFPYPPWSNRIQALLRVTIYVVFPSATLRYFLVTSLGRSHLTLLAYASFHLDLRSVN